MTVHLTSKDFTPTADAVTNIEERDVVGNKVDAAATGAVSATESLMAYAKQNVTNTELLTTTSTVAVERTTGVLPQGGPGQTALFTVTGVVQILEIRGEVTTQIGNVANDTKLIANSTAGTDVDLCAAGIDVDSDDVGTIYSLSGTFANVLLKAAGNGSGPTGAFESQANPITVTAGTIDLYCAGTSGTGSIQWTLVYKPVSSDGAVVVA